MWKWIRRHKNTIVVSIALLFHISGAIGMFTSSRDWFIRLTPLNLLLMMALLLWTQNGISKGFIAFFCICFITGMGVETIGVHTGWLFGQYEYGTVLGVRWNGVPLLIGVNWFIMVYCAGINMSKTIRNWHQANKGEKRPWMSEVQQRIIAFIDGALIVTVFDWIMEPVAVKLGFWTWLGNGQIPFYNYLCWFLVTALLLQVFLWLPFKKENVFAENLLIIQFLFFASLRTFL
jgi:putative membrane protein